MEQRQAQQMIAKAAAAATGFGRVFFTTGLTQPS